MSLRTVFSRFWPYTRPFRGRLLLGLALGLGIPLVQAMAIWMFKLLVDRVLVPHDLSAFWPIAGAYLAITVAAGALGFASSYLSRWLAQYFVLGLRTDLYRHLHSLSLDVLERSRLGDVLSRLTSDVTAVERLVVSGVTRTLGNVLRVLLFTGLLCWLQWQLALVALAVLPAFAWIARVFSRRIKEASRQATFRSGAMAAAAEEGLAHAPLVQAYQQQQLEVSHFHAEALQRLAARLRAARLSAGFGPLVEAMELVGVLMVVGLGTWQMSQDTITLGGLLAFLGFLSQLYSPVRSLSRLANTVYSASAGAERIVEIFDSRSTVPQKRAAVSLGRARGVVEFDDVSFRYPGSTQDALTQISLLVHPGEVVALAGHSGAGKSTMAKLVSRLYDPTEGAVRLDGHDLRDLTVDSVRSNVSLLLQETMLFHGTIFDNIAYGRPGAAADEVLRAAELADVSEFADQLPEGYGTVIGEQGRRLSGGQRQRIAIARALVRDTPVLILDEPSTGLDTGSQDRLAAPLRRVMAGRSTILIAHDQATLDSADRVIFLDHGSVIATEPDHLAVRA